MVKRKTIEAIAALAKRRVSNDAPKPVKARAAMPTPEQMERARYVEEQIVDDTKQGGVRLGKAYRRKPKFEKIDGLSADQLSALRVYRQIFDRSEQSEVKSALDVRPRGAAGSDGAVSRLSDIAFARRQLLGIDREIGATLHTLRDIALHDLSFSEAAMKRFGSREVDVIDIGKGKRPPRSAVKLRPKSGRHREIVREEFFTALSRLVPATRCYRKD